MFDIGFSELLVIALVALVVLGPERLPKAARMAGMWLRRARLQWQAVKSELENELADEDMRRSILRARDELREAQDALRADGARLRAQLADVETRMTAAPAAPVAIDAPLQARGDDAVGGVASSAVSASASPAATQLDASERTSADPRIEPASSTATHAAGAHPPSSPDARADGQR
jgi:sec-independent protein translocase protein TatB